MPLTRQQLIQATHDAAAESGLRPGLFIRQIKQESDFNPNAISGAGAQGIAQIMPATARAWHENPHDPVAALRVAAKQMAALVAKHGEEGALRAYNAGEGAIEKSKGYSQTNNYVKTILGGLGPATPQQRGAVAHASSLVAGGTKRDTNAAILDVFAAHKPGSKLKQLDSLLSSGAYDSTAPAKTVSTPTTASAASAPADTGSKGVGSFEGKQVAGWIAPILSYARAHGWKGSVNSGYRSLADQTRIYNSGVRPAAKPGTSNHEFTAFPGGAIDVTDAAVLSKILLSSPYASKLVWAGGKDPVHFSHPHNGSY